MTIMMILSYMLLGVIAIAITPSTATTSPRSIGWFIVLKRSSGDTGAGLLYNSTLSDNNNNRGVTKIHRLNLNNHEKVDFMNTIENKHLYDSSVLSGLFLIKSTFTSEKTFRILEFSSDLNVPDETIHERVTLFVNHLNHRTQGDTKHEILFKEKNYIIKSHEFKTKEVPPQSPPSGTTQFRTHRSAKLNPYALYKAIRYFPTTLGHNNTNRTRIRNLDINAYCRFVVGSGRLGYQPGSFSWGIDILDQRGGNIDGSYCPYGGSGQGQGTHVYVLDSGIGTHSSMDTTKITRDFDYYYNVVLYNGRPVASDLNGHGSHVAGLIASRVYGVAPNTRLHIYKVLDDQGSGSFASLAAALSDIYDKSVRSGIISMSLGTTQGTSAAITFFINSLHGNRDFTIVASSGNDNANSCNNYPSNIPVVISIGAISSTYSRAFFSNYGACVTIYSPGNKIISCGSQPSSAIELSGTSMAAPIVTGTLAILKQLTPTLTSNNLRDLLLSRGTKNIMRGLDGASPNNIVYNGLDIPDAGPVPTPNSPGPGPQIPPPPSPGSPPPPPSTSNGTTKSIHIHYQWGFILILGLYYTMTLLPAL
jgi:subtilisin family serine protease